MSDHAEDADEITGHPRPVPMPSPGQIVLYRLAGGPQQGNLRPAMVSGANDDGTVDLVVFLRPQLDLAGQDGGVINALTGTAARDRVCHDAAKTGCWSWPAVNAGRRSGMTAVASDAHPGVRQLHAGARGREWQERERAAEDAIKGP